MRCDKKAHSNIAILARWHVTKWQMISKMNECQKELTLSYGGVYSDSGICATDPLKKI